MPCSTSERSVPSPAARRVARNSYPVSSAVSGSQSGSVSGVKAPSSASNASSGEGRAPAAIRPSRTSSNSDASANTARRSGGAPAAASCSSSSSGTTPAGPACLSERARRLPREAMPRSWHGPCVPCAGPPTIRFRVPLLRDGAGGLLARGRARSDDHPVAAPGRRDRHDVGRAPQAGRATLRARRGQRPPRRTSRRRRCRIRGVPRIQERHRAVTVGSAEYPDMRTQPTLFPWPPARTAACWCGSGRKYKQCCRPHGLGDLSDAAAAVQIAGAGGGSARETAAERRPAANSQPQPG